jgi:hypothetical protein
MSPVNQRDLFGAETESTSVKSYAPSAATVRAEVNKILDTARTAKEMPWSPKEVAFWKTVIPQMTNWLPEDEAEKLRAAFLEEICRLETVAVREAGPSEVTQRKKRPAVE